MLAEYSLGAQDVAVLLGVSIRRVHKMADDGLIRYRTVGPKRRLYSAASVLDLAHKRTSPSAGAAGLQHHGALTPHGVSCTGTPAEATSSKENA